MLHLLLIFSFGPGLVAIGQQSGTTKSSCCSKFLSVSYGVKSSFMLLQTIIMICSFQNKWKVLAHNVIFWTLSIILYMITYIGMLFLEEPTSRSMCLRRILRLLYGVCLPKLLEESCLLLVTGTVPNCDFISHCVRISVFLLKQLSNLLI